MAVKADEHEHDEIEVGEPDFTNSASEHFDDDGYVEGVDLDDAEADPAK